MACRRLRGGFPLLLVGLVHRRQDPTQRLSLAPVLVGVVPGDLIAALGVVVAEFLVGGSGTLDLAAQVRPLICPPGSVMAGPRCSCPAR